MILLKMLLSVLVLHFLWLGSVLSPSHFISPRMILRTPPLGHCPHSCSSAKSMPTVSPITTARAVHLVSHSLARGIGGRWQLAGRVFAATGGRTSRSSVTQQPHRVIYRVEDASNIPVTPIQSQSFHWKPSRAAPPSEVTAHRRRCRRLDAVY